MLSLSKAVYENVSKISPASPCMMKAKRHGNNSKNMGRNVRKTILFSFLKRNLTSEYFSIPFNNLSYNDY